MISIGKGWFQLSVGRRREPSVLVWRRTGGVGANIFRRFAERIHFAERSHEPVPGITRFGQRILLRRCRQLWSRLESRGLRRHHRRFGGVRLQGERFGRFRRRRRFFARHPDGVAGLRFGGRRQAELRARARTFGQFPGLRRRFRRHGGNYQRSLRLDRRGDRRRHRSRSRHIVRGGMRRKRFGFHCPHVRRRTGRHAPQAVWVPLPARAPAPEIIESYRSLPPALPAPSPSAWRRARSEGPAMAKESAGGLRATHSAGATALPREGRRPPGSARPGGIRRPIGIAWTDPWPPLSAQWRRAPPGLWDFANWATRAPLPRGRASPRRHPRRQPTFPR